jgi:hypothetical protein
MQAFLNRFAHTLLDLLLKVSSVDAIVARYLASARDQELGAEIPHEITIATRLILQERKGWLLVGAIDIDLRHHHALEALLQCELLDINVAPLLLVPELIAGESQDLCKRGDVSAPKHAFCVRGKR